MTCVRTAWVTLGSLSVPLENPAAGYFCSSLDLGYPAPREVVANRPDATGTIDRTMYASSRVVSADITAIAGAGAQIDAVAAMFAPLMVPSARPVLHYVLDRPGAPERTLTLRASGYSWPVVGGDTRDIQLQWVAADPVAKDPTVHTAIAWSGSSTPPGRMYPLTFNRIYPPGGGAPVDASIYNVGDTPLMPLLRVYGPITHAIVFVVGYGNINFLTSYTIPAGQWVDVDCDRKTVYANSDPTQNAATALDWQSTQWAVIPPQSVVTMILQGGTTSGVTQVQAIWQNGYLT